MLVCVCVYVCVRACVCVCVWCTHVHTVRVWCDTLLSSLCHTSLLLQPKPKTCGKLALHAHTCHSVPPQQCPPNNTPPTMPQTHTLMYNRSQPIPSHPSTNTHIHIAHGPILATAWFRSQPHIAHVPILATAWFSSQPQPISPSLLIQPTCLMMAMG